MEDIRIKVMRLSPPQEDPSFPSETRPGALLVPTSLQKIFVGETFQALVYLSNESHVPLLNVVVKLDLVDTRGSRSMVFNNSTSPILQLATGKQFATIVQTVLDEEAEYLLTCQVSFYQSAFGDPITVKKSYRFPALAPFDVNFSFSQSSTLLMEASLTNNVGYPIMMKNVKLDHVPAGVKVQLINETDQVFLKTSEAHNFVFELTPETPERRPFEMMGQLGELNVEWRSAKGACGFFRRQIRLQALQRPIVDLRPKDLPPQLPVEKPCDITFELRNISNSPLTLTLLLERKRMNALLTTGPTRLVLGHLQPNEKTEVVVCIFPVLTGLQPLRGFSILDEVSAQIYHFDGFAEVAVF